ncbi:MAG: hypothetical protein J7L44_01500 [Candidatus Diapherotrites archaeon]|nr:hypothetical protein [Candidatus Diapherotrites archaeon]
MVCSYRNSKGKLYYLHKKGKLYYFSQKAAGAIDMPAGYEIVENTTTGLPMLKKKG